MFSLENEELFKKCYEDMYQYMINKDIEGLDKLLDESFILIHMTGMRQSKQEFLEYLESGRLNYFSAELENAYMDKDCNLPIMIGQSLVQAAVFGGGRSTWRLQLTLKFRQIKKMWLISEAVASIY